MNPRYLVILAISLPVIAVVGRALFELFDLTGAQWGILGRELLSMESVALALVACVYLAVWLLRLRDRVQKRGR